jgi:glyoxylase-like metal-dependent hydrolase (beta-lactamase superfamily II)
MVDGGYGLYYEDVKGMLRAAGLGPEKVSRIYLSHADADHAGMSGHFAREFKSRVYLHRAARGVVENENRAYGSDTPLLELNHHFTVLVNEFTGCRFPGQWYEYGEGRTETAGGFLVVDRFETGGQQAMVLESLGGHVPGQVFFCLPGAGLIFTGDYLLDVDSLAPREREILNYPKFMMTSTNVNSAVFRREMQMLRALALRMDEELRGLGRQAVVVPGHGDWYAAGKLG